MVKSILDDTVNYPEIRKLDEDDRNYDATLYEHNILGIDVIIALGQGKYTFIENNLVYYPIYLVKDDKVDIQIGVYETLAANMPNITDGDGDLELEKLNEPLLYSFTNKDLLLPAKIKNEDVEDVEDAEDAEDDKGISAETDEDSSSSESEDEEELDALPEQTKELADEERKSYQEKKGQLWIQKFMKNNNFSVIDNEGGGDCFFAVIRDALKELGRDTSVKRLREQLSDEVTEDLFHNYLEHYSMYVTSIKDANVKIKALVKKNKDLRDRLKNTQDRQEQLQIVNEAKIVAEEHQILKNEKEMSMELLSEFKFMKGIKNIDDFKKKIKTCEFWADTWAVSTLERVLNLKFILFSAQAYDEGDMNNVLQCGQLNDAILEEKNKFEPSHYIMMDYTGEHYKLITYKNHRIFTFKEIPYDVKLLVTNKCLERLAGPYYIIPQFRLFHENLGISIEVPLDEDIEVLVPDADTLYDDDTTLQYYLKSSDKPLPGKGSGEKIKSSEIKNYSELAAMPHWRRQLSNMTESPFELDGLKWQTVEHYYQGSKFKNQNPNFYKQFSLNSETKLSKDAALAKAAGSKQGGLPKQEKIRPKSVIIDEDFFGGRNKGALKEALYAKFFQNDHLKKLLMATNDAKLVHFRRGKPGEVSNELMDVRRKFQK